MDFGLGDQEAGDFVLYKPQRCWNRVALHHLGYRKLRQETPLGAQMVCNAIHSVCSAYRSQYTRGRIVYDRPVPLLNFDRGSVHFDRRTYTLKGEAVSLNTLQGRICVPMILADHQRRMLKKGTPKEADLVLRKGRWFFNLVAEEPCLDWRGCRSAKGGRKYA